MRTVHLCAAANGTMIADVPGSTRSTYIQVSAVPDDVSATSVARRLHLLAIWPWPTQPVCWGKIADLKPGTIVRDLA